jgi:hypothetical protein
VAELLLAATSAVVVMSVVLRVVSLVPLQLFSGRGFRTTPAFQGAYFTGRSIVGVSKRVASYNKSAAMPAITSHGVSALSNQPTRIADRTSPIRGQQDRAELQMRQSTGVANSQAVATNLSQTYGSIAGRNRISASRAVNRSKP